MAPTIAGSVKTPAAYNQVFNVGADQPYSVNELAGCVAQAMGVEPDITHLPARNEVLNAYSSHEKERNIFGDQQRVSLEEGLKHMAEWVKSHGARSSHKFKEIEVTKNFPKAWLD